MTVPAIVNGAYPIPEQPWRCINSDHGVWDVSGGCLNYNHGDLGPLTAHIEQTLHGLAAYAGRNLTITFDIADSSGRVVFVPVFSLAGGPEVAASTGVAGTGYTVSVPVGTGIELLKITNHWTGSAGEYFCLTNIVLAS